MNIFLFFCFFLNLFILISSFHILFVGNWSFIRILQHWVVIIELHDFSQFDFKWGYLGIILDQGFCILTRIGSNQVFSSLFFNYMYIFYFHPITFYLLEIELQLFLFHFSFYRIIIFPFELLGIDFWTFFSIFFL
jgi:hypothetical protein